MKLLYDKELFQRYYKDILKNIGLLIIISVLSITAPLVIRNAFDYNNSTFRVEQAGFYLFVLTLLYCTKFIYNRFRFWFMEKFKNYETVNLYQKTFHINYNKMNQMEPTYIAERINSSINTIFNLYSTSLSGICVSVMTVLVVLIVVIRIDMSLAVLYFLQIPLQYFGFQKMLNGEKSKLSKMSYELQTISAKSNKNIKAVISDVNSLKQYSGTYNILSFIQKNVCEISKMERKANSYAMDICTILDFVSLLLKNGSYIYIMYLFILNNVTIGDMIYLNLVNDIYYSSISELINIQINLRDLHGAIKFVSDEIEGNYESDGTIIIDGVETITGMIHHIGYENTELIKEGKFELQRGDIVALVGDSGTGKSTFVKMLNKFLSSEGIKVNGHDIMEICNASIRDKVFYLAQNSYLLPFSIRENITLGNTYSEEKWNQLLELDFMQKFINQEQGLDMSVYENGTNLSGGDKQKIMLGRIFLQEPDVIILDESFNALDEKSGEDIVDKIVSMYSDKIIILISHSDKYLKNCNKKIQIKDKMLYQTYIVR